MGRATGQDAKEHIRRNTLLHGLILHRLKTLLRQREKFYPSKGCTSGQEGKEFEACVVGKQLHHVKGTGKNILEREISNNKLK